MKKVALITGANRGLGWGLGIDLAKKGYHVLLGSRKLPVPLDKSKAFEGLDHEWIQLDVTVAVDRANVVKKIQSLGRLDVLVNNAGVFKEDGGASHSDAEKMIKDSFDNNALAPYFLALELAEFLKKSKGNLVNVSSGMGGLSDMGSGYAAYRFSKVAMNASTRILHTQLNPSGVRVNSVCPGWVKTDMGGAGATRELDQGVASLAWAATLGPDGPSGGFYRDGISIPW